MLEKAEVEQAFLKIGFYGDTGSGKTFTSLQIATHLGKTAMIATERGMDFYAADFDFDIARVSTLEEANMAVDEILAGDYTCCIVDQVTHLWEYAQDEYITREHDKMSKAWGTIERSGNIPFQGWKSVKKPYKKFLKRLLDAPLHVFFLGRLATEYEVEGDSIKKVGEKMAAEKETPYEPHLLIKMEFQKRKGGQWLALAEKDHSRTIQGKVWVNPGPDMLDDVMAKLGKVQGKLPEPIEDTSTTSIVDEPVRKSQIKIIRTLCKKGEIKEKMVENLLKDLKAERAGEIINQLTLGDYSCLE